MYQFWAALKYTRWFCINTRKLATNRAIYPRLAKYTRRFSTIPGKSGKRPVEKTERRVGGGGKRETRDGTSGRFGAFGAADRGAGVSRLATEVGLVVSQMLLKFLETNGFDWI